MIGLKIASRRVATIACSNTRPTLCRKRSSWRSSRAKDFTTRTPDDVLLGVRGELGDALLDLLHGGPREPPVTLGDDDDERDWDERDEPELGIDQDHRHAGEDDRQRRLQDEDEAVAEEEADLRQVDGRPRHELTRLLMVEEPELELLQMGIEALAQVVLDAERDAPGDHAPGHGERPAQGDGDDDEPGDDEQRVAIVGAQRDLVVLAMAGAALHRVDRAAGEVRDEDGHHHRHRREHPRDAPSPVGRAAGSRAVGRRCSLVAGTIIAGAVGPRSPVRSGAWPAAVPSVPGAGLCNTCVHQRVVSTTRGSRFSLCERSRSDPRYARYPRLPVQECPGYEPGRRPAA